jgi:hypothetical protein
VAKPARKTTIPVLVRVPPDMRAWLEGKAEHSTASLSSEAVRAIRAVMDREHEQRRAARKREREAVA